MNELRFHLGVKSDPIENRFSYEWLFRLMAEEDVRHVQLGSFVALYHLPDNYFIDLKRLAGDYGVEISTVFTTHREMGGFFRHEHPAWGEVTRRNYKRLIEIGVLLGANAVGASAGSVMRDRMDYKEDGMIRYIEHIKEMMHYARECGLPYLTIEPMSCLAEPPTLPDEIRDMAEDLLSYHHLNPSSTVPVGYCVDVTHGYANHEGKVIWDNMFLLEAGLPYIHHLHLKNTDHRFDSTFGFMPEERKRGIIDVQVVRKLLDANAAIIPMTDLICYLEIGGPKTGRDYSDYLLERMLRESLQYLKKSFLPEPVTT